MRPVTVRIACVQLCARPARDAELALRDAIAGIEGAAACGAQIAVLPESTYPGYVLLKRRLPGGPRAAAAARVAIGAAAKAAGVAVCIGIARRDGPHVRNEAVYFDRRGAEIARSAKFLLWSFDRKWFTAGESVEPFDTEFGRIGMMVCADGRMPEIARSLRRRGAWLVLDPTAWVGDGASYDSMRNPQADFMLRVRAKENALWIAAADKCGSELGAVHYVGRSAIVAPDGSEIVRAGPSAPAIVVADARPSTRRPIVAALNERERRSLAAPARARSAEKARTYRLGVIQGPMPQGRGRAADALRAQSIDVLIDTTSGPAAIRAALRGAAGLRAVVLRGAQMLAPEPARAAALDGADLIVWARPPRDDLARAFARTRAVENRVFVLVCATAADTPGACMIDPSGAIPVEALERTPAGFIASVDTRSARDKAVAPGTDAFADRVPRAFALFDGSP